MSYRMAGAVESKQTMLIWRFLPNTPLTGLKMPSMENSILLPAVMWFM